MPGVSPDATGTHTSTFSYGPDRSHYKRVDADGTTVKTTLSIGNVEFISHSSGVTETKRYIADIAVVTDSSTAGHSEHTPTRTRWAPPTSSPTPWAASWPR
ncbi:MAG: hypothetical protein Q7U82_09900 [Gammaproteobacteria bacterium]|nr:hypothetical protein [Gammaproteobacteria bacterium]